jgi:hypothetical protein
MAGRQGACRRLPSRRRPGNRGKRERRARGTYSRAHLELLRTVEAAPRESRGGGGATGGGGAVLEGRLRGARFWFGAARWWWCRP